MQRQVSGRWSSGAVALVVALLLGGTLAPVARAASRAHGPAPPLVAAFTASKTHGLNGPGHPVHHGTPFRWRYANGARAGVHGPVRLLPGDVVWTTARLPTGHHAGRRMSLVEVSGRSWRCVTCEDGTGWARDLGNRLELTVTEPTDQGPIQLYTGPLIPVAGTLVIALARTDGYGGTGRYRLSVAMPRRLGNAYQGTTAQVVFAWRQTATGQPGPGSFRLTRNWWLWLLIALGVATVLAGGGWLIARRRAGNPWFG